MKSKNNICLLSINIYHLYYIYNIHYKHTHTHTHMYIRTFLFDSFINKISNTNFEKKYHYGRLLLLLNY